VSRADYYLCTVQSYEDIDDFDDEMDIESLDEDDEEEEADLPPSKKVKT
jgi:hypothetical protein